MPHCLLAPSRASLALATSLLSSVALLACQGGSDGDPDVAADAGPGDCEGAACPNADGLSVIASEQDGPTDLVLADGRIYWSNEGNQRGAATGNIAHCPIEGCGAAGPEFLYEGAGRPRALHVTGQNLYFLTTLYRTAGDDLVGSLPVRGTLDEAPVDLSLYAGNAVTEVDQLNIRGGLVYFSIRGRSSDFSIMAVCELSGCPSQGMDVYGIEDRPGPVSALTSDSQVGYYAKLQDATIMSSKDSGGTLLFEGEVAVMALQADASHLYWGTSVDPARNPEFEIQNYIARGPKTGGVKEKLVEVDPIAALHLDGDWLYFAETSGRVARLNKVSGNVEEIATGQNDPRAIRSDSESVYWVNYGQRSGQVVRWTKP